MKDTASSSLLPFLDGLACSCDLNIGRNLKTPLCVTLKSKHRSNNAIETLLPQYSLSVHLRHCL